MNRSWKRESKVPFWHIACHEWFSPHFPDINLSLQRANSVKCMGFSEYSINFIKVKCAVATNHQMKGGKTHMLTHRFIAVSEGHFLTWSRLVQTHPVILQRKRANCLTHGCTGSDLLFNLIVELRDLY